MTPRGARRPVQLSVRQWLDTPLPKRPWPTWPLLPLFAFVSFVVALVAALRRGADDVARRKANTSRISGTPGAPVASALTDLEPLLVCVGNVVMGGAGKSPVAQALLSAALERGCTVALVARGYGVKDRGVCVERADVILSRPVGNKSLWGDELMEHVWLLAQSPGKAALARCYLVQGASRAQGLAALKARLKNDGLTPVDVSRVVVVLDDGLQHFGVRPQVRLCVWPEALYDFAPKAAFPLGPYREGFGSLVPKGGFDAFLAQFDAHVWSRVAPGSSAEEKTAFASRVRARVAAEGSGKEAAKGTAPRHLIALARSEWVLPEASQMSAATRFLDAALTAGRVALVCGIASPEAFVRDAKKAFQVLHEPLSPEALDALEHLPVRLLSDHGALRSADVAWLQAFDVVVTTAKDASRHSFPSLGENRHLWVLCVKIHFEDTSENRFESFELLSSLAASVARAPEPAEHVPSGACV